MKETIFIFFSFIVSFADMKEAGLIVYSAACHQGAIKILSAALKLSWCPSPYTLIKG